MNLLILILTGSIAASLTFALNNSLKLGAVIASASISVLGALFFYIFPDLLNEYLRANLPAVIMGASFVGMASEKIVPRKRIIYLSGILFSIIYIITGPFFDGFGGSLGTSAAISLILVFGLQKLIMPRHSG